MRLTLVNFSVGASIRKTFNSFSTSTRTKRLLIAKFPLAATDFTEKNRSRWRTVYPVPKRESFAQCQRDVRSDRGRQRTTASRATERDCVRVERSAGRPLLAVPRAGMPICKNK